jgi:DNA-binding XRE family transcriptional regulator
MMHEMRNTTNPTHAQQLVKLQTSREVPDLLRELYVDRRLSQADIAVELGISRMTVAMWLREHSINRDDPSVEATA